MSENMFHRLWLIGFAGHRRVDDPERAKAALRRELDAMVAELDGEVVGVSSAAAGADLLFLEACRDAGLKTVVLLPFDRQRFAQDFEDPAEWRRAEQLIDGAWWHETVRGNEEAPAAYHVVSRDLLDLCDRMIFLWDGQPPRGLGGTGETVMDAQKRSVPARIVNAENFEAGWQGGSAPVRAADDAFAELPQVRSIRDLFEKLDARAVSSAPKSRWFNAGSMSVNHVATFVQAFLLAMAFAKEMGGLVKFALAVVAATLPWVGARLRFKERWFSDRVRAELLRSVLASHGAGSPLRPTGLDLFTRHAAFLRSAALLLVADRQDWKSARDSYLVSRLDDQLKYLGKQGAHARGRMRFFRRMFYVCSFGAMLLAAAAITCHLAGVEVAKGLGVWGFGFLPAVLPGVAAWSLAMVSVFEFKRRAGLYAQMVEELKRLRPKLEAAECASATAETIYQAERLLMNELWEWQGTRGK